ncbi:MAG: helix-turn-helix transcriptional regulator [Patescibacteria group bacterium]|jgi:transcriptional regulator with XRE-family HTH domain
MDKTIYLNKYKRIVEKLKSARLEAGLTQKQIADRLKVPQSYISKVEAGDQRIDIIELKAFADLYKKSITYFI